jgi:hypothetical protein
MRKDGNDGKGGKVMARVMTMSIPHSFAILALFPVFPVLPVLPV